MKWKTVIYLFVCLLVLGMGIVGTILYYHFDWKVLADLSFYENLANPSVRIVRIQEGLRKEQIADTMANKFGWTEDQKDVFMHTKIIVAKKDITQVEVNANKDLEQNLEGHYFPKTYMLNINADTPEVVSGIMFNAFNNATESIVKKKTAKVINQETALTIASIIQREAAGKQDMNLISGIIWNRIFKGMKLQIDATLQYAKGTEDEWWPQVESADKNIESPYNTYKYTVPPGPIANPGLAAISAAYNPQKTTCLFYLHDKNRKIHCAATYKEHLKNIDKYY